MRKVGDFICADFFQNSGGLNTADSPFVVDDGQATGGKNYDYALTGGFRKSKGKTKTNTSADSQLKSYGFALFKPGASTTKTLIRAAGRQLQKSNSTFDTFTALTTDVASPVTNLLANGTTVPVVFSQFNTTSSDTLWAAGGGMDTLYGIYDPTSANKVTANGSTTPTGSFTLTTSADASAPDFVATGYYRYAVAYHKLSSGAVSNAALFKEVHLTTITDKITIDISGLTGLDQTLYDKVYIYRSAVSATALGDVAFTTGDTVAKLASNLTTYADTGGYLTTADNIPGSGNSVDNSKLPSGTYQTLAVYKRRLVTATGSTVYLSDLNKPESWPAANPITVPSGGPITALAVLSYASPTSPSIDEILCIFKEQELWVLTGSSSSDFALKFIDNVGCPNQPLICTFNGTLAWIDYRGPYIWDGSGKPIYVGRTIADYFKEDGNVDLTKLNLGWGTYSKSRDQVIWVISSVAEGEQLFSIKMDTRLTQENIQESLGGKQVDAVLIIDMPQAALYAGSTLRPVTTEIIFTGDASGYVYKMFDSLNDNGAAVNFQYESKYFDLGMPGVAKRIHKVIVWCADTSDSNLTLDFWTKYNNGEDERSTLTQPISRQVTQAYYDLAYYDAAYYDLAPLTLNPLVFNISSATNSGEGDCLKLRFTQADSNAPLTIAGFSVLFTEAGLRK